MSKNYIEEQESKGKSKVSRRWKVDIKNLVNDYNFRFDSCYEHDSKKCDFCGTHIKYVAVITGDHISDPHTWSLKYEIGFDCLQLVFGRDWNDYRKAKQSIDDLKKRAAQKRRKEDYAERYEDIIEWFNKTHPDYVNNNYFLCDMKDILFNGTKVFTINMEGAIRKIMKSHSYTPDEYEKRLKHLIEEVIPDLEKVYNLVCEVDEIIPGTSVYDAPKNSSYKFVSDVYHQAKRLHRCTPSQLHWMNKIHDRYVKKQAKKSSE